MLDTPENRNHYIERARKEKLAPGIWIRAWFAIAERNGKRHFVVHGLTREGRATHLNLSGVPCAELGLPGRYLAGESKLREVGFETHDFDGSDAANEITPL
jgi:hypothetical protein